MTAGFAPGLMIKRYVKVARRRELPIRGEVLVKQGQRVSSNDVVAKALLPGELRIVRIAEDLGITAPEVKKVLRVKEGDAVNAGDILATHSGIFGLFESHIKAPSSGHIELISTGSGHISIRANSNPITLNAYISGVVKEVMEARGVIIETSASCIQGIFGVGGERVGTLKTLDIPTGKEITESDIPNEISNRILVGGCRPTLEALHLATKRGACGVVTGSIDDQVLKEFLGYDLGIAVTGDEDIATTLIITEGFGKIAMSEKAWTLFSELNGKHASINGATQVRAGAVRPEIIVEREDLKTADQPDVHIGTELKVGSNVRIIRVPYFGEYGVISELPHGSKIIETGAEVRVAVINLKSGQTIQVPRANLEIIQ